LATFSKRQQTLRPLLKENEDYLFSEIIVAEELVNAVRLLKGDYENVTYYYGHVKMVPVDDLFTLAYQYTIWDSAGHSKAELAESPVFKTLLGDILVAIIADEKDKGEYVSLRSHDPEESDLS
jgi:hypothetical protein